MTTRRSSSTETSWPFLINTDLLQATIVLFLVLLLFIILLCDP